MYNLKLIMCYTAAFTVLIDSEYFLEEKNNLEKEFYYAVFVAAAAAVDCIIA